MLMLPISGIYCTLWYCIVYVLQQSSLFVMFAAEGTEPY